MRPYFLAPLALMALMGLSLVGRAEYVVVIVNLASRDGEPPPRQQAGGQIGAIGGALGFGGGAIGEDTGGAIGTQVGGPGAIGGAAGGPPPQAGGRIGMMIGGPPQAGGRVGMMIGGPPQGGGRIGGPGTGEGGPADMDADEEPRFIVAVLEVTGRGPLSSGFKSYAAWEKAGDRPVLFVHKWGQTHLWPKAGTAYETIAVQKADGSLMPRAITTFNKRYDEVFKKEKPATDDGLKVAQYALEHGLPEQFAKCMDELAKHDKSNASVAAYLKIKDALAAKIDKTAYSGKSAARLLDGYKVSVKDDRHFAVMHNSEADDPKDVLDKIDRLERSFKSYYYWWALKGIVLPVPKERQLFVVAGGKEGEARDKEYKRLRGGLTSTPGVADGFFARREGLSVYAGQRRDDHYNAIYAASKGYWEKGFVKDEVILGDLKGIPDEVKKAMRPMTVADKNRHLAEVRTYALLMKAMEDEWEATSSSHKASRQLLFASGLLPNKVNAPEWVQFGMGSFFEVPLQSPWSGIGAPSPYWMPRFREYDKGKKYGKTDYETLIGVITDGLFRAKAKKNEKEGMPLRRARAASWALTYFLAQRELTGLQAYFKELSKLPRDVELSDKALIACFARAFNCVDLRTGKPDPTKLKTLAERWTTFVKSQPLEGENVHKKIRELYTKMTKPPATGGGTGTGGGTRPGQGGKPGGTDQ